ncbi:MAG: AmmeMemoRadiSam system radical SAM enzyme [Bacteroidetes bacterium]|nr:MAG: AmmeMemoRadiSam system radical SAM enzyme [Bacteroidota bacterium]
MGSLYQAAYYEKKANSKVRCQLCPHNCLISPGETGICLVRKNNKGTLYAENYGMLSANHFDPIEKKPLYHFHPGKGILSIGTYGCNLKCEFCQNSGISQTGIQYPGLFKQTKPQEIVDKALEITGNIGIAYTYNEPIIWFEYVKDVSKIAKKASLKNVMVSNGYINAIPRKEIIELTDAFNIDLKAFTKDFYKNHTSSFIEPVKASIKDIYKAGKHLEITNLIIPTLNDDPVIFEKMIEWIARETSEETVLHLSRYFPHFKVSLPPTEIEKLSEFYQIAKKYLKYVYLGNVANPSEGNNTFCPECNSEVIVRSGYRTWTSGLDSNGKCKKCGTKIIDYM